MGKSNRKGSRNQQPPKQPASPPIDYSPLVPMQPSKALGEIVGPGKLLHSEASRRVWMYVKSRGLQDPTNKLMIKPDKKLAALVGEKALSTVELTRAVMKGLKKP